MQSCYSSPNPRLTFVDDGVEVPPEDEDGHEGEVEEDGEGDDDPGEDLPRVPRPALVHRLLRRGLLLVAGLVIVVVVVAVHPSKLWRN